MGSFCTSKGCKSSPGFPACPVHATESVPEKCICAAEKNVCSLGNFCYENSCKTEPKRIVRGAGKGVRRFCGYREGACGLTATGKVECTFTYRADSAMKDFPFPSHTHETSTYVDLSCEGDANRMCLITESGKLRCFNNDQEMPRTSDGDVSPLSGKFVSVWVDRDGSSRCACVIRDDGALELFGAARDANHNDDRARDLGLTSNNGRVRIAPDGKRIVQAGGTTQVTLLYDDGTIDYIAHPAHRDNRLEDIVNMGLDQGNVVQFLRMPNDICYLNTDGVYKCSKQHPTGDITVREADEGTFALGGCASGTHMCAITSMGKVNCWGSGTFRKMDLVWENTNGKYLD